MPVPDPDYIKLFLINNYYIALSRPIACVNAELVTQQLCGATLISNENTSGTYL